jgi:hypothetical protein
MHAAGVEVSEHDGAGGRTALLRGALFQAWRDNKRAEPATVATLQVGGLLNSFGNGVVMPFLFIYLHNVRGIGLATAGLVLATHALVSIVAGPVFGSQIDRVGGKRMLGLALAILTVGFAGYALVETAWQGFLVAAVSGIGVGGFWPAQSTLIAGLTPTEQRPAAFSRRIFRGTKQCGAQPLPARPPMHEHLGEVSTMRLILWEVQQQLDRSAQALGVLGHEQRSLTR